MFNPTFFASRLTPLAAALMGATLLAACGGGSDGGSNTNNTTADGKSWQVDSTGQVTIRFGAYQGSTPVDCSSSLKLGSDQRAVKLADLRFYIADVELIKADGSKVKLKLKQTDDYHYQPEDESHNLSLIDLENAQGDCDGGSTGTNTMIEGTVPAGQYTGVAMTLGVPFALNHLNAADAATPRVLQNAVHPGMSWNWRGGRKFTNIQFDQDRATDPTPWQTAEGDDKGKAIFHLGSTGCLGNPAEGTPISSCKAPNRAEVVLSNFNPGTQVVALDVGTLFGHAISSTTDGDGACMSGATDTACAKPFAALALDWKADGSGNGQPVAGQSQQVFKAMTR